jgi:hypothetical protein
MAGSLTIGGSSDGLLAGSNVIGPVTINGKTILGDRWAQPLAAGDNTFQVPNEATAALVVFPFTLEGPEVKIRTNLDALDGGLPVPASGFAVFPLLAAVTSVILHASGGVGVTEMAFI